MQNSSSKMEPKKPVVFKAGIPLALSLAAGFIIARIATRKSRLSTTASQQSQIDEDIQDSDSCEVEEEMFGRIEAMQDREWELEKQFQDLKDQEIQHLNKKVLYLGSEISLIEATKQRFAVDYLNLFRFLENFKSENGKLHKRAKKLLRKSKQQSGILRKQRKQIQCKETKTLRTKKELELKGEYIRVLEDEIKEKNALLEELRAADESQAGEETTSVEEQDVEELIQLRLSNASLTHELARRNGNTQIEEYGSDNEVNGEGDSYFGSKTQKRANSRRRKLITKFKRWMEGGEKTKEEKHRSKCFPRHSVSDEDYVHARKSCSSV